jgi:hypothetical protein
MSEPIKKRFVGVQLTQYSSLSLLFSVRGVQRVNAAYKERVELNRRLQSMLKYAKTT